MITKTVEVRNTCEIEVTIDETKFDEEFMKEFKQYMYPSFTSLDDHIKHIAQLGARNLIGWDRFIEGYGEMDTMGISYEVLFEDQEEEIISSKEEEDE